MRNVYRTKNEQTRKKYFYFVMSWFSCGVAKCRCTKNNEERKVYIEKKK